MLQALGKLAASAQRSLRLKAVSIISSRANNCNCRSANFTIDKGVLSGKTGSLRANFQLEFATATPHDWSDSTRTESSDHGVSHAAAALQLRRPLQSSCRVCGLHSATLWHTRMAAVAAFRGTVLNRAP